MAAPVVESRLSKAVEGGVPKKRRLQDGRPVPSSHAPIPRRPLPAPSQRPPLPVSTSRMIVPGAATVKARPPAANAPRNAPAPVRRPPSLIVPGATKPSRPMMKMAMVPTQRPVRGKAPARPLVVPGMSRGKSSVLPPAQKAGPLNLRNPLGAKPSSGRGLVAPAPRVRPRGIERLVAQPPRPVIPGAVSYRGGRPQLGRGAPMMRGMPPHAQRGAPAYRGARRPFNHDPYGLDELTEEDRAFIDDGNDGVDDEVEWRKALRDLTGYDPSKFAHVDDGEAAESNLYKVEAEEHLSEMLARREDYEEYKKSLEAGGDDEEEWEEDDEEDEDES